MHTSGHLLRYTDLPSAIHILSTRQLTLLSPSTWDDKNDSTYIDLYKEKQNLKSVLALCFTQASETYHHWRVFAPSSSGVCLRLSAQEINSAAASVPGVRLQSIEYQTIKDLKKGVLPVVKLPFLKRYPFKPEQEARLLWESATEVRTSLPVPIGLHSVSRITLSPWLHPSLVNGIKRLLKSLAGCEKIPIYRSTLVGNADWIKHGRNAA